MIIPRVGSRSPGGPPPKRRQFFDTCNIRFVAGLGEDSAQSSS